MKIAKINVNCKITFIQDLKDQATFSVIERFFSPDFDILLEFKLKETLEAEIAEKVIIDIKEIRKEILDGETNG